MIELTGKQRRYLRSLAQQAKPLASVGKAGLSDDLVSNISRLLEQHELVKVRVPAGSGADRAFCCESLAQATQSACIGVVGRVVLLYRPNPDLAKPISLGDASQDED